MEAKFISCTFSEVELEDKSPINLMWWGADINTAKIPVVIAKFKVNNKFAIIHFKATPGIMHQLLPHEFNAKIVKALKQQKLRIIDYKNKPYIVDQHVYQTKGIEQPYPCDESFKTNDRWC